MELSNYLLFVMCCLNIRGKLSDDPCTSYKEIQDESMQTNYTLGELYSPSCDLLEQGWYRYMVTSYGALSNNCPTENSTSCGTRMQVWMNGSNPGPGCEERVSICVKGNGNCCELENNIRAKNCNNSYMVYQIVPTPRCSRFCFDSKASSIAANGTAVCISGSNTSQASVNSQTMNTTTAVRSRAATSTHRSPPTTSATKSTAISNTSTTVIPSIQSNTETTTTKSTANPIMSVTTSFSTSLAKLLSSTKSSRLPTFSTGFPLSTKDVSNSKWDLSSNIVSNTSTKLSFTLAFKTIVHKKTTSNNMNVSMKSIDTSSVPPTNANLPPEKKHINVGLIAGASVGSLILVILVLACSYKLCCRGQRVSHELPREKVAEVNIAMQSVES